MMERKFYFGTKRIEVARKNLRDILDGLRERGLSEREARKYEGHIKGVGKSVDGHVLGGELLSLKKLESIHHVNTKGFLLDMDSF